MDDQSGVESEERKETLSLSLDFSYLFTFYKESFREAILEFSCLLEASSYRGAWVA